MRVELPSLADLHASGARPRVHGNGFLQLDLTPDVYGGMPGRRLHVWHPDLPKQVIGTTIHDHVFDLASTVIAGKLTHVEFAADEHPEGDFGVFYAQPQRETNNTVLVRSDMRVNLRRTATEVYFPNTSYTFPAYELHDSYGTGLTATIIEKISVPAVGTLRPRVLVPYPLEPDNDFDREGFDPDRLWPFVDMALKAAWGTR